MEKPTKEAERILAEMAKDSTPSTWREKAEERKRKRSRKAMVVALKILDALDAKGMSKTELAMAMGVSRQRVNEIVKGANITTQTIEDIESALGIVIIPEDDQPRRAQVIVHLGIPIENYMDFSTPDCKPFFLNFNRNPIHYIVGAPVQKAISYKTFKVNE